MKWYYTKLWNALSLKHLHEKFEILIALSGKAESIVNDVPQTLVTGTVVLSRPGDIHEIRLYPNEEHLHRDIYIATPKMKRICDCISPSFYNELTESVAPVVFEIEPRHLQLLESKLLFLENIKYDPTPCTNSDFENLHTCIVYEILSDYMAHKISRSKTYPEWIQELISYLNNPNYLSLKISELAKLVNYSREHLCRAFKKTVGQTLESYITESRINYSLSLLSDTDLSVAYIANELGYESQNSFTRNFRKQIGITPMAWRKNHLKLPDKSD